MIRRFSHFRFPCFLFLGVLVGVISTGVQAAMVLDKIIVRFNPDQSHQDVVVQNPDKEPLYLATSVVKVVNPGAEDEKRITITDPDKMELLVSPQKVIIPSGGRKTIRMVSLTVPKKKEAVYRVNFTPVVGKVKATKTAVKILIGYQALVFVRPENSFFQVTSRRQGNNMIFTNTGDVNVLLRNGKYCPKNAKKDQCVDLKEGTRLYAGSSWTMKLPPQVSSLISKVSGPEGSILFGLYDGKKEHDEVFSLKTKTTSPLEKVS